MVMGAYASNCLNDSGDIVAEFCDPSSPNWLTAHSEATGLCQSRVEELWKRFKDLGGDETKGVLLLSKIPNVSENEHFKKLLEEFSVSKDDQMTFQTFCVALKWNEGSNIEEKIKESFKKMNNSEPLTKNVLLQLLKKVYTDESEASLKRVADVFMSQMNGNSSDVITEKDFILWMKTMPFNTVKAFLDYSGVQLEANCPECCHQLGQNVPSYEFLEQIAEKIYDKDWHPLANKLGFIEEDIQGFQRMNPTIPKDQIQAMLNAWRNTNTSSATIDVLIAALQECNLKTN